MTTDSTYEAANWATLQMLFHLAEDTPAPERKRVLTQRCNDPAIVERALRLYDGAEELQREETAPAVHAVPGRVGPYTLLQPLGSGGIGTVYLAERLLGGVPQRVAVKMLSAHAAGQGFMERFSREQHILSSLDHPHITHLLDAGRTEAGGQYLVMEYVDGEHLDIYCDARRLGIEERLRIFLQVCDAVAYAHRNLVVHLDLKPSNILVSREGSVKLLDFGTSKLIQPDSLLTTTVLATPAYSSPEQLRNEPVTTACDIYSLGAVLFESLSGRRPYVNSSLAMMIERAIAEQGPPGVLSAVTAESAGVRRMSETGLRQALAGDLATIVRKCLEPRPLDRYTSVEALADDVSRFLDGNPIRARRQTVVYRFGKFLRRHRTAAFATVTAALVLCAAIGYGLWRQEQAFREAQRAERMQTFMHQLFRLANSDYTGKPAVTVPEFLQLGIKTLPEYIRNPEDLLQAKIALAESTYDNGDLTDAKSIFMQTAATARSMKDIEAEAESEAFAGQIAFSQGDIEAGRQLTAEALRLSQQRVVSPAVRVRAADYYAWNRENFGALSDEDLRLLRYAADEARRNNLPLHERAEALHLLASNLEFRGHFDEAKPLYDEVLGLLNQEPASVCDKAEIYGEQAFLFQSGLDYKSALPLYQRAYDGYSACSGADGREALSMLAYVAATLTEMGRATEAVPLLERSRPAWEKLPDPYGRWAVFPGALARAYIAVGRYKEAEDFVSRVYAAQKKTASPILLGFVEYVWAAALAGQHRYQEALPHIEYTMKAIGSIPPAYFVSAEGHRRIENSKRLLADIRAHLDVAPQNAAGLR